MMNSRRDLLWAGLAVLAVGGCATGREDMPREVRVPGVVPQPWPVSAPQAQGIDPAALDAVLNDAAALPALRALLVVRNGQLVAERYYGGLSAEALWPVQSVTQSVASVLVGQAMARGLLPGLYATVGSLLPEASARVPGSAAAQVTLRQILTGHTGLEHDWPAQRARLAASSDPLAILLALPPDPEGPDRWTYNNAAVGLLSSILVRAHGGTDLADVAARDLFAPLGIDRFAWRRDVTGAPTTFSGLMLRPRDVARLAVTMADGGNWRDTQVVPPGWAVESTRAQGPAGWQVAPVRDVGYGYLWFTGRIDGQAVAWAWGYGAQFALVVPALRLAVVTAAQSPRTPNELGLQNAAVMGLVARIVRAAR